MGARPSAVPQSDAAGGMEGIRHRRANAQDLLVRRRFGVEAAMLAFGQGTLELVVELRGRGFFAMAVWCARCVVGLAKQAVIRHRRRVPLPPQGGRFLRPLLRGSHGCQSIAIVGPVAVWLSSRGPASVSDTLRIPGEIVPLSFDADVQSVVSLFRTAGARELDSGTDALVRRWPASGVPWKLRGIALQHLGRGGAAELEKAARLLPGDPEVLNYLGIAYAVAGRANDAEQVWRRALEMAPAYPEVLCNLGGLLSGRADHLAADALFARAIAVRPDFADAHFNRGVAQLAMGRLQDARHCMQRALELNPSNPAARFNLGLIQKRLGDLAAAEAGFCAAIEINPRLAEAHWQIGKLQLDRNDFANSEASFRRAIAVRPEYAAAYAGLGVVLAQTMRMDEAEFCLRKAISLDSRDVAACGDLGLVLAHMKRYDEAEFVLREALQIVPQHAPTLAKLGSLLNETGRQAEAEAAFHRALEMQPDLLATYQNLLSLANFRHDAQVSDLLALAKGFDQRFCTGLRSVWPVHANDRDPSRRLRVGYVSADFRHHAVAYFMEPILARHDVEAFDVYCFSEVRTEDEYTSRFRKLVQHWHPIAGLDDTAAATLITSHRIDILVDLSGHTDGNRMLVFARKPAPVQITYLGYPGSTGLAAMDYKIGDIYATPSGSADAAYTETLLRLPHSLWCFQPTPDMPDPSPLPASSNGWLTFGSFNSFNKVDDQTIRLWIRVLNRVPRSRLLMVTVPDGQSRVRLIETFRGAGVSPDRLEFCGKLPHAEFQKKFLEVDVSLDPVNVNGATTTCESLWMGVPVITLAGDRFLTRAGFSILSTAGLAEFAASSPDEYVEIAARLAADPGALAELRATLRSRLAASRLADAASFTRNLEALYRYAWQRWCDRG